MPLCLLLVACCLLLVVGGCVCENSLVLDFVDVITAAALALPCVDSWQ